MGRFIKRNYYWIIAAVALLQMLIYGGAANNFSGHHVIPVTEALGFSRTAFSLAESLRSIVSVGVTFFSGFLFQKFGYRKTVSVGLVVASIAYVLFASMSHYWMLVAGCVLMGVAHGVCATAGVSRLVSGWFHKYRGTVLGLVTAATGFGSTLLGFAQSAAIEYVSWRLSFIIVSGLQVLLALIIFLLVRNEPDALGLRPFGEGQFQKRKAAKDDWQGFSYDFLKRSPIYYLLCVAAFLSCVCILATQYNIKPFLQDCGMAQTRTSYLYGIMMTALGIYKLVLGVLCDIFGARRMLLFCHLTCAAGLVMILLLPQTDVAMIAALIVYVTAIPITTMMFPLVSGELFGNHAQIQYVGAIMAMTYASNILSGPISNAIHDGLGSYAPVFWGVAVISLVMIPVYCLLYAYARRIRNKQSAKQI